MANKTVILCPGQGAQVMGMGAALHEASAAARAVFDVANQVAGYDLAAVCFGGPEDKLNKTDVSQPAIFATSVASFRTGIERGLFEEGSITAFAGLSLGEYTALHLAGAFTFEQGMNLVMERGKLMQEAATATLGGMVALMGADEAEALAVCEKASQGEVLVPANFNTPGQIVLSGTTAACQRALTVAEEMGFKSKALVVAGAFHSPLMQPAADAMKSVLDAATFEQPGVTVYSNVTAKPHGSVASIKQLLVEQIVKGVRWEQTMVGLLAEPDTRFIELSPGRTLAGLAKRINRRLPIESAEGE